jgi:hypothetical protein
MELFAGLPTFFEPVIPDRQKKIPKWDLKIPDF